MSKLIEHVPKGYIAIQVCAACLKQFCHCQSTNAATKTLLVRAAQPAKGEKP